MPTFPLGTVTSLPARHIAYRDRVAAAQARAASQPETPATKSSPRYAPDPMTVRGIPAVGRNCPGHIRGTQPEHHATR